MKITISRDTLAAAVANLGKVIEKRTTLPILAGLYIEAGESGLVVTATNLDIWLQVTLPATVDDPGTIALPFHALHDFAKTAARGAMIEIETAEGRANLVAGRSRASVSTLKATDFPRPANFAARGSISMPFDQFAHDMARLAPITKTVEETRYYLQGVNFAPRGAKLDMVATDGHRAAWIVRDAPDLSDGWQAGILPRVALPVIAAVAGKAPAGTVTISRAWKVFDCGTVDNGPGLFVIDGDGWRLVSKTVDGTYPDWTRIFPSVAHDPMTFEAKAMAGALKRVRSIASKGRTVAVAVEYGGAAAQLRVSDPEAGAMVEDFPADAGDNRRGVAMNATYLADLLALAGDGLMTLGGEDAAAPWLALFPDSPELAAVMMPMRGDVVGERADKSRGEPLPERFNARPVLDDDRFLAGYRAAYQARDWPAVRLAVDRHKLLRPNAKRYGNFAWGKGNGWNTALLAAEARGEAPTLQAHAKADTLKRQLQPGSFLAMSAVAAGIEPQEAPEMSEEAPGAATLPGEAPEAASGPESVPVTLIEAAPDVVGEPEEAGNDNRAMVEAFCDLARSYSGGDATPADADGPPVTAPDAPPPADDLAATVAALLQRVAALEGERQPVANSGPENIPQNIPAADLSAAQAESEFWRAKAIEAESRAKASAADLAAMTAERDALARRVSRRDRTAASLRGLRQALREAESMLAAAETAREASGKSAADAWKAVLAEKDKVNALESEAKTLRALAPLAGFRWGGGHVGATVTAERGPAHPAYAGRPVPRNGKVVPIGAGRAA